ncbi:Aste57867_5151 [Aphanomyces stellatus]|uniref:Aste57867_5151 protein n=1 Tax=Aphanomyces stellatus TaxID=120398 RepID=A0A485KDX0_9STRA|nr:hypothetical protein As57867_005138 [Aphanomyces stellatus]VFT82228.1 Aste57867_5151 [Aphanomyces stellatus]
MRQPNTAAFGDDHLGTAFSTSIANYVQWAYGSNTLLGGTLVSNSLPSVLMMLTSNVPNLPRACAALARPTAVASDPLRHIFNISQVAVLHASNQSLFDMTFKVTGNGGHSHNDMGSYEILVNNTFVLGDAGGPLYYEARTFDSRRYLSPLMNSFGHPVPVVAGMNQSEAVSVQASHKFQLNATLSPMVDTLTTDLAAAYAVPTLESLVRQVTFDRTGLGKITIQDTVTMKAGAVVDFESAFTALGAWTSTGSASGSVTTANGNIVTVCVFASAPFSINTVILSDYNVTWTRVGIRVKSSTASESVTVVVQPASLVCPVGGKPPVPSSGFSHVCLVSVVAVATWLFVL